MSYLRYLARRAALAVLAAYLVVTATFALVTATVSYQIEERIAAAQYAGASPEELEALREGLVAARNLDTPLHVRYVDWLVDVTTLEWGYSFAYGEPVIAVLDGRVQTTLGYVLPGVALAVAFGVGFGLFAALAKDSPFDWSVRLVAYALFGVPSFVFIVYVRTVAGAAVDVFGFTVVLPAVPTAAVAALTVAVSLFAGQVRFSRTASLEQSGRAFVKMLRAKGADRLRVARHVLRNAALPIVSLSVTELLTVMVFTIYVVEEVLGIRGLAGASLQAFYDSDVALIIWTTMVIVFIGITGNFLQDVIYGYLDPRVRTE